MRSHAFLVSMDTGAIIKDENKNERQSDPPFILVNTTHLCFLQPNLDFFTFECIFNNG